jgi:NAD(P)-dependent dehydrogenase (short-subunit alcohol dehydrogenase family)
MRLQGRVALVIGGASGLGRASAECCAKDGAKVVIADVNEAGGAAVVEGVRAGGGQALFVRTDAGDEAQVKAAIAATVAEFGKLDILINSAGAGRPATADGWHFAIDHFLKGPYYACRHALPEMEKNGGGVIINVASLAGVTGVPVERIEDSGYSCAKHGVIGLTRTLALAYAKKNIRVNAICPGYIKTGLTQSLYEGADGGQSLISEKLRIPMDRWGEAHEIGTVAAFLASDDASFITGQPIIVDGGFMAR